MSAETGRTDRAVPRRRPSRRSNGWKVFVTIVVLGVLGTAAWVLLGSRLLVVREVEVAGQRLVPRDRLLSVAQVRLGTPLARVDTAAVRDRVAGIQEVESAWVERRWPATVRIVVRERVPLVVVARDGRYLQIDRHGMTVLSSVVRPRWLPELKVAGNGPAGPATRAALAVWQDLPGWFRLRLATIEASSPESVTLRLNDGITVVWGAPERAEDKLHLAQALLGVSSGKPPKTIDVSSPEVVTTR